MLMMLRPKHAWAPEAGTEEIKADAVWCTSCRLAACSTEPTARSVHVRKSRGTTCLHVSAEHDAQLCEGLCGLHCMATACAWQMFKMSVAARSSDKSKDDLT